MTKPIKEKILAERGLVRFQPDKSKHHRIRPQLPTDLDGLKTARMYLIELQHGKSIEELLSEGSLNEIADTLGIVKSTASKWKKKLGLGR